MPSKAREIMLARMKNDEEKRKRQEVIEAAMAAGAKVAFVRDGVVTHSTNPDRKVGSMVAPLAAPPEEEHMGELFPREAPQKIPDDLKAAIAALVDQSPQTGEFWETCSVIEASYNKNNQELKCDPNNRFPTFANPLFKELENDKEFLFTRDIESLEPIEIEYLKATQYAWRRLTWCLRKIRENGAHPATHQVAAPMASQPLATNDTKHN